MTRVNGIKYVNDPTNYYFREPQGPQSENTEDYIIKSGITTNTKIATDKLAKGIFVYPKKGLKGSKNSNFYEFLTMTTIPTIAGSLTMMSLYNVLKNKGVKDFGGTIKGNKMIASVLLYAAGKWLGSKMISLGTRAMTGVDMDMAYKSYKSKLPEFNGDKNLISEEFHKVFESVDFPRWDIINAEGLKQGNKYQYYDKIAKRMGAKEPLEAPDQIVQPKIKEVVTKAKAASSISKYLWAALGVCIGSNLPTANDSSMSLLGSLKATTKISKTIKANAGNTEKITQLKQMKSGIWTDYSKRLIKSPKNLAIRLGKAINQFYSGKEVGKTLSDKRINKNKFVAVGLTALAVGSTIFGILNTKIGFKLNKDTKVIDDKKPYVEA